MLRTITRRGRRDELQPKEQGASRARTLATRAIAAGGAAGLGLLVVRALRGRTRQVHGPDVVDLLLARHREVRQHMEEYERSAADPRLREHLLEDLRIKLSGHEAVEEQLVHPLVRRNLPDGHRIAAEVLTQEQEAQELLAEIERTEPHTPRMDELTGELFAKMRLHAQTEETEVFPALRLYLGPRERMRLGTMVERVERLAPTHPEMGRGHRLARFGADRIVQVSARPTHPTSMVKKSTGSSPQAPH